MTTHQLIGCSEQVALSPCSHICLLMTHQGALWGKTTAPSYKIKEVCTSLQGWQQNEGR